jgi:hypothetical protein
LASGKCGSLFRINPDRGIDPILAIEVALIVEL